MTTGDLPTDPEALPDDIPALTNVAVDADVDPYLREAAIKKLATVKPRSDASDALNQVAEHGLTAIERDLARKKITEITENRSN